jgi:hypothetical protein
MGGWSIFTSAPSLDSLQNSKYMWIIFFLLVHEVVHWQTNDTIFAIIPWNTKAWSSHHLKILINYVFRCNAKICLWVEDWKRYFFFFCVQNSWKKTLPHLLRDFSNHKHPKEFKLCMNEVASKDNVNGI